MLVLSRVTTVDLFLVSGTLRRAFVCARVLFSDTFLGRWDLRRAVTKSLFAYPYSLHCARVTRVLAAAVLNAAFVFDVPVRYSQTDFGAVEEGSENRS